MGYNIIIRGLGFVEGGSQPHKYRGGGLGGRRRDTPPKITRKKIC